MPLQHDTPATGAPCKRCGLRYGPITCYTPCFEPEDTFDTWLARQSDAVREIMGPQFKRTPNESAPDSGS